MSSKAKRIIKLLHASKINLGMICTTPEQLEAIEGRHYYVERWVFSSKTRAITLKKYVLHQYKYPSLELIMHEEEHVHQYLDRKKGFHLSYFVEWVKRGYRDNRYEREAREEEKLYRGRS